MTDRDDQRLARAREEPIVGGLPDAAGIGAAMRLTPGLGRHLRGLADELLVHDYPGATLRRDERELLATAVSAANDCFFCMDSHGAFATALFELRGATQLAPLVDVAKAGASNGFDPKMQALLAIARTVGRDALALTSSDVTRAKDSGATDADVQLAVLIAAAFSMYNRMVDGLRARTPADPAAFRSRAAEIAENGYSAPSRMATPPSTAAPDSLRSPSVPAAPVSPRSPAAPAATPAPRSDPGPT